MRLIFRPDSSAKPAPALTPVGTDKSNYDSLFRPVRVTAFDKVFSHEGYQTCAAMPSPEGSAPPSSLPSIMRIPCTMGIIWLKACLWVG